MSSQCQAFLFRHMPPSSQFVYVFMSNNAMFLRQDVICLDISKSHIRQLKQRFVRTNISFLLNQFHVYQAYYLEIQRMSRLIRYERGIITSLSQMDIFGNRLTASFICEEQIVYIHRLFNQCHSVTLFKGDIFQIRLSYPIIWHVLV